MEEEQQQQQRSNRSDNDSNNFQQEQYRFRQQHPRGGDFNDEENGMISRRRRDQERQPPPPPKPQPQPIIVSPMNRHHQQKNQQQRRIGTAAAAAAFSAMERGEFTDTNYWSSGQQQQRFNDREAAVAAMTSMMAAATSQNLQQELFLQQQNRRQQQQQRQRNHQQYYYDSLPPADALTSMFAAERRKLQQHYDLGIELERQQQRRMNIPASALNYNTEYNTYTNNNNRPQSIYHNMGNDCQQQHCSGRFGGGKGGGSSSSNRMEGRGATSHHGYPSDIQFPPSMSGGDGSRGYGETRDEKGVRSGINRLSKMFGGSVSGERKQQYDPQYHSAVPHSPPMKKPSTIGELLLQRSRSNANTNIAASPLNTSIMEGGDTNKRLTPLDQKDNSNDNDYHHHDIMDNFVAATRRSSRPSSSFPSAVGLLPPKTLYPGFNPEDLKFSSTVKDNSMMSAAAALHDRQQPQTDFFGGSGGGGRNLSTWANDLYQQQFMDEGFHGGSGGSIGIGIGGGYGGGMNEMNFPRTKTKLPNDFRPDSDTVVLGKGNVPKTNVGNLKLKGYVVEHVHEYSQGERREKIAIISKIIRYVRSRNTTITGFVKYEDATWWEMTERDARVKVTALFRDCLHEQYRSSSTSKVRRRQKLRNTTATTSASSTGRSITNDHTTVSKEDDLSSDTASLRVSSSSISSDLGRKEDTTAAVEASSPSSLTTKRKTPPLLS